MPRKLSKGGKPVNATGTLLKIVRLELPDALHKQFRVEAAKEGVSMASMARRLVEEWMSKRKAGSK
jgi:hypothetical protein